MSNSIHKLRFIYVPLFNFVATMRSKVLSKVFPYKFTENRYSGYFLSKTSQSKSAKFKKAKQIIYCFWTGDNPITEARLNCLKSMQVNTGVEVQLITPKNLSEYILPEAPLHSAYKHLSCNHKSDYLRCYFMHFHGGGYADIKTHMHNWTQSFNDLNQSDNAYLIGYPEIGIRGTATTALTPMGSKIIDQDMRRHWPRMVGFGAFICKAKTPLTDEWYSELMSRMDYYASELESNPGNIFGTNHGYPIPWTCVGGQIGHPLFLKYNKFALQSTNLLPLFINYR